MKHLKKILCFFFSMMFLVSAFSINSSAKSVETYNISSFDISLFRGTTEFSGTLNYPIRQYANQKYTGIECLDTTFYASGQAKQELAFKLVNLSIEDEYNIKFSCGCFASYNAVLKIALCDGNKAIIYDFGDYNLSSINNVDFNFTLKNLGLTSNKDINLFLWVTIPSQYGSKCIPYFTDIQLTNKDDNDGFLDSIKDTIAKIYYSIVGGEYEGVTYESLADRIGNKISVKFDEFKQKLDDFSNNIKEWFSEKFDFLLDYILYFEHPVELNSEGIPIRPDGTLVYTNPFSQLFEQIFTKLKEWADNLKEFSSNLDASQQDILSFLDTFKNGFNRLSNGVPIIATVISFAVIFIVIKKVVGR